MGEPFRSFDESWRYFLARGEPMESFFDDFVEEPQDVLLAGWLVAVELEPWTVVGSAALS